MTRIFFFSQFSSQSENISPVILQTVKNKSNQNKKGIEKHGCNHPLLVGHWFQPLVNSTEIQEDSKGVPELHKASSVADLNFNMTLFSCGFAPFCAKEKSAGLSSSE